MKTIKHFNLEIIKKCNQKCFYCFNDSGYSKSKDELSITEWINFISEIHNLGYKSIHLTGGEPFLHPNIVEILSHSIELGLETTILSNGLKISNLVENHPNLIGKLKLAQISLDSMDAKMHNSRRGFRDAFKDAMDAINALIKVNVPIEISATVSEENLQDLFDIGTYCKTIGASLIVRPLISTGRATDFKHKSNFSSDLEQVVCKMQNVFQVKVIEDKFNYVADDEMSERYFVEKGTITVEATGKIRGISFLETNFQNLLQSLKVA